MAGRSRLALAALALGLLTPAARADDIKVPPADPVDKPPAINFALPGEDPPAAFVPKTPRTVAEQKKVEAIRLYVEARSLEDQRQFTRALLALENALENDPESVPILRRLSFLCEGLGKTDRSIEYGRRAIAADPGDPATTARIVGFYRREPAKAEAFLKEVLANPKLDKGSSDALVLQFELAQLYERTGQFDKAADALAKVVEAIDTKVGNRLTPADQRRILGDEEAATYVKFGGLFLKANRRELALRCFRRAEVYDDSSPQIPLMISLVLLESDKGAEALQQIERALNRHPEGREAYDALAQILKKLGRGAEVLPRIEAAAKAEPKNIPLQYALADRYREAGQAAKADELVKTLIEVQPDLKGFAGLYASFLKEKKTEDLLQLLTKVAERIRRDDAVEPQVAALLADPAYTDKVIDTGLAMLTANPPRLDRTGWIVLVKLALRAKKTDKLVDLYRWAVREFPSPQASRELIDALAKAKRYDEAEAEFDALMNRFPEERNPGTMLFLAQIRINAHREDAAIAVLNDLLKQDPNDFDATRMLAFALSQKGKGDEAVTVLREGLKKDPANIDLLRTLAFLYQQGGKNADMIAFLKELVDKFPNNEEVVKFARSNLSIAYTNLGDYAKGEAELEVLFAKNPEDPGVNNDLGYLYAEQGKKLEQAEGMIRKAVADEPENAAYLDSLGWILFKRGKAREAVEPLQKAIENLEGREDATIPEHLGDVYFEIKDRAKARELWEKAEKVAAGMTPPDKRLPEIRKKLESLKKLETGPQPASGTNP